MEGHGPATYGDRWADIYDRFLAHTPVGAQSEVEVATLAELAGPGPVLELGLGTGRVALPLAKRGLEVCGIEASEAMLERLRAKPGGDRIPVAVGDFADVKVEGRFSLVFATFATFFALPSQEEQVRCFANVANHLTDDGHFVIEAFVPDPNRFAHGQGVSALRVDLDLIELDVARHHPVTQRVLSQRVVIGEDGIRLRPTQIRYAYPSELDLMARLAGLSLRERWGGWDRRPFDATSPRHVSVYQPKRHRANV